MNRYSTEVHNNQFHVCRSVEDKNEWWRHCYRHEMPCILVAKGDRYAKVTIDLWACPPARDFTELEQATLYGMLLALSHPHGDKRTVATGACHAMSDCVRLADLPRLLELLVKFVADRWPAKKTRLI